MTNKCEKTSFIMLFASPKKKKKPTTISRTPTSLAKLKRGDLHHSSRTQGSARTLVVTTYCNWHLQPNPTVRTHLGSLPSYPLNTHPTHSFLHLQPNPKLRTHLGSQPLFLPNPAVSGLSPLRASVSSTICVVDSPCVGFLEPVRLARQTQS
jgi:hypothetical protein